MLAIALTGATAAARADVSGINNVGFFNAIPHTLIDFETDGAGASVSLIDGESLAMPSNEYAPQGVLFAGGLFWVNDGSSVFDTAQAIGGSGDIAIPSSACNQFTITFTNSIFAMGFWVVNNVSIPSTPPTIAAYDAANNLLGTVEFGGIFIDGQVSNGATTAEYGFMGLSSATAIDHVVVSKQFAIFDDLRYSAVPSPGPLVLAAFGAGLLFLKRKR